MGDEGDHAVGFIFQLSFGEVQHGEAKLTKVEIARVVAVERDRALVVEERVDFDYELLCAPEEVDLVATEVDIGLGVRQVVALNEGEEVFLEVGAGAAVLGSFEVDAFELGLALRAA